MRLSKLASSQGLNWSKHSEYQPLGCFPFFPPVDSAYSTFKTCLLCPISSGVLPHCHRIPSCSIFYFIALIISPLRTVSVFYALIGYVVPAEGSMRIAVSDNIAPSWSILRGLKAWNGISSSSYLSGCNTTYWYPDWKPMIDELKLTFNKVVF